MLNPYLYDVYAELNKFLPANSENDKSLVINARRKGNATRFLNHSCKPNIKHIDVFICRDRLPVIAFFALTDIKKDSQLFVDYGQGYWKKMNTRGIFCHCGIDGCKFSREEFDKNKNTSVTVP